MPSSRLRNNKIIRTLIASDIIILSSFALINPIFAVFVTQQIKGGTIIAIGFATTIFLLVKSLLQVPIAQAVDKTLGETDDFVAVFIGSLLVSAVPFAYIFIGNVGQLYLVEVFHGIGAALVYPAWNAIFTRHVDCEHVGVEWGTYSTLVGLGAATSAALGGMLAQSLGFPIVFSVVGILSILGSGLLLYFFDDLRVEEERSRK
ncbi:MAG: MFS transporter [bacterium]|nr:MFS transporter [bacterium]